MPSDLHLESRLDLLENENTRIVKLLHKERRRFKIQAAFATIAIIGAIFCAPGARRALADDDKGDKDDKSVSHRVTILESGLAAEITARNLGDVNTLSAGKSYTDGKVAILQAALNAEIARAQAAEAMLNTNILSLQSLTASMSLAGTDLTIKGVNVHIVNGTDGTFNNNGLGNLILGYNETRVALGIPATLEGVTIPADYRSGSHNLITGVGQNYSGVGCIVAGFVNGVDGRATSVLGGGYNLSSGSFSVVAGGLLNQAKVNWATVTGGSHNLASGDRASVNGGSGGTANGFSSSITGGTYNTTLGDFSSITGGGYNLAKGYGGSVTGGYSNTTGDTNNWASVTGGFNNYASGFGSSVSGGGFSGATNTAASVSGGIGNLASLDYSSVSGGYQVFEDVQFGWAAGGHNNPGGPGAFHST